MNWSEPAEAFQQQLQAAWQTQVLQTQLQQVQLQQQMQAAQIALHRRFQAGGALQREAIPPPTALQQQQLPSGPRSTNDAKSNCGGSHQNSGRLASSRSDSPKAERAASHPSAQSTVTVPKIFKAGGRAGAGASSSSARPASQLTALMSKIDVLVDSFEERLWEKEHASGRKADVLERFVTQGLLGSGQGPQADDSMRPRRRAEADDDNDGLEEVVQTASAGGAGAASHSLPDPTRLPGPTHLANHLRSYAQEGNWDTCLLEQCRVPGAAVPQEPGHRSSSTLARAQGHELITTSRVALTSTAGWKQLEEACVDERCLVRGWVCGHDAKHRTMRVRIVVIESPSSEETESQQGMSGGSTSSGNGSASKSKRNEQQLQAPERLEWLQQPHYKDGFFGVLHTADMENFTIARGGSEGADNLLPVGTLVRARLQRDKVDRRLMSACEAHVMLSLMPSKVSPWQPMILDVASTKLAQAAARARQEQDGGLASASEGEELHMDEEEWPAHGVVVAVRNDPHFTNQRSLQALVRGLGLRHLHSTLRSPETQSQNSQDASGLSQSEELSRRQNRSWSDRRVREAIAKARTGDHKAALERYDAALELMPQHKEGLIGRGASLVKVGRLKDAVNNLDVALLVDPTDANAIKYREIALQRLRDSTADPALGGSKRPRHSANPT